MKSAKHPTSVSITGGQFRGLRLLVPPSGTHPMGSRERLALFNMLDCHSQRVLDLFAGAGTLGLEALSRGAAHATFVEKSPTACRMIRENIAKLGVQSQTDVTKSAMPTSGTLTGDMENSAFPGALLGHNKGMHIGNTDNFTFPGNPQSRRGLSEEARDDGPDERPGKVKLSVSPFDIVLVDPPYDHPEFFSTKSITFYANFVKSGATLVLSHPKNLKITPPDSLKLTKSRQYATLGLDFFTKV